MVRFKSTEVTFNIFFLIKFQFECADKQYAGDYIESKKNNSQNIQWLPFNNFKKDQRNKTRSTSFWCKQKNASRKIEPKTLPVHVNTYGTTG